MSESKPFGPDELKPRSRDFYVGNESDTDEYGETQPGKLLALIGAVVEQMDGDAVRQLTALAAPWLTACAAGDCGRYEGAEESAPVFAFIHDWMWDRGEHPYCDTIEDWHDQYDDLMAADDAEGDA